MKFYVSAQGFRDGDGSLEKPFQRIQQAADVACPGDEVIVKKGIYREYVNPKKSGEPHKPIRYRSEEPGGAVITGAECLKDWIPYNGTVWTAYVSNGLFGSYNPYTTLVEGDWFYSEKKVHTGEVYLNGKSMYEAESLGEVLGDTFYEEGWYPQDARWKWFSLQEDGKTRFFVNFNGMNPNEEQVEINVRRNCFFPEQAGKNYITVSGFVMKQAATQWAPPTAFQDGLIGPHWSKGWVIEDCEIADSKCCGISLGKYLQPDNENKWSRKRMKNGTQTQRDAVCQALMDGWNKEHVGSHVIRRCHIHDCEQAGIAGHMGCSFSVIEDNHIHHINTKHQLIGAEVAGIKLHAAIDVSLRRNHIHHCTKGMWMDWQAQGTRITQNLFHHNIRPKEAAVSSRFEVGEDLFIEVSHGPTLVDNNIFLSPYACRLCAQGVAFVHNLIGGSFVKVGEGTNNGADSSNPRYTPYHFPHRTEIAGFMTFLHGDVRLYNNIFVQHRDAEAYKERLDRLGWKLNTLAGTEPFADFPMPEEYFPVFFDENDVGRHENREKYYKPLPVYTSGNVFLGGARPGKKEKNFISDDTREIFIELEEINGRWFLKTNLYEDLKRPETLFVSTETLGEAFEPEQRFENPDGTEIIFSEDYFGYHRSSNPLPGPFESALSINQPLF